MEVILLRDVEKVGLRGEVVNVSRGYMRNFLQPRRLAEPATPARVAELERLEAQRARHEARSFEQAQEIAETLRKTVLRFDVNAGPRGTLFGSVTATDVADELWRARKIRVDRRKIELPDPIKRVGRYEIPVDVFQDVRIELKTLVVPEGGELPSEDELAAWEAEEAAEAAPEEAGVAERAEIDESADAVDAGAAAELGAGEEPGGREPSADERSPEERSADERPPEERSPA